MKACQLPGRMHNLGDWDIFPVAEMTLKSLKVIGNN